jgi:hypothetical protein
MFESPLLQSFQVALEMVMLQGGFAELMGAVVDGSHYTLASECYEIFVGTEMWTVF